MGRFLPLSLSLTLVCASIAAHATVSMSQSHNLNGDIGPTHAEEAVDHVQFGTGRGNLLHPGLGSEVPFQPLGSALLGFIDNGAMRVSGEALMRPFGGRDSNFISASLEASFDDSLTFGGVAVGTSLRVSYSYITRGSILTACRGTTSESLDCATASWEFVAQFGSDRLTLTDAQTRTADGRVSNTRSVDSTLEVSPYGIFTHQVEVIAGQPVQIGANARAVVSAASTSDVRGYSTFNLEDGGIFWGGIHSVSLTDGTLVEYTLTSDSGTNYRESLAPVPEPSTWTSLLVGIGLLAVLHRWSRKERRKRWARLAS